MTNDCCAHPRWRHKLAALSPKWRAALVAYLISKGIFVAWLLHPVAHVVARWFGLPCP